MIRGSSIGAEFDDARFELTQVSDANREAIDACKRIASGELRCLVLAGPVGLGKTHALVCTAREYVRLRSPESVGDESEMYVGDIKKIFQEALKEYEDIDGSTLPAPSLTEDEVGDQTSVYFWAVAELAERMQMEALDGVKWTSLQCRECDLLILDDMGVEKTTEFVLAELEKIINHRYREQLPMAVSTNMDLDEFIECYGNRAISRCSQYGEIVEMSGRDLRAG